jgi:hypothetical protein
MAPGPAEYGLTSCSLPFVDGTGQGACTVVVPNLEKMAKSGKFLAEIGRGECGFRVFELSKRWWAWEN